MLEISNLRQRIEYISQISKQRDLIIQNKTFNEDFNSILEYIDFCNRITKELEGMLVTKYNETINNVLRNAFSEEELSVISDVSSEHTNNSFRFNINESVFKKILNSLEIVGENTEEVKNVLSSYLFASFSNYISVDIENRILTADSVWRIDKVEGLIIDYILPGQNSILVEKETDLQDLEMKWFKRLFKKEEYLREVKQLEDEIASAKAHIGYINLILQEDGLLEKFCVGYKKEVQRFMSILSDYLEKYTGKQFFIQE
jgi:hypothetical protein